MFAHAPGWRNWQTQGTQNPPTLRSYEFDPRPGHYTVVGKVLLGLSGTPPPAQMRLNDLRYCSTSSTAFLTAPMLPIDSIVTSMLCRSYLRRRDAMSSVFCVIIITVNAITASIRRFNGVFDRDNTQCDARPAQAIAEWFTILVPVVSTHLLLGARAEQGNTSGARIGVAADR